MSPFCYVFSSKQSGPLTEKLKLTYPDHTGTQKGSSYPKEEQCQGMLYPYTFAVESILAKRWLCTHGRILRYIKYGLWTRQIRMTSKGNLEEISHKNDSNYHESTTQQLSDFPSESACMPVYMYCNIFPLNNLTCFHCFPSLWKFFSSKPKGQGPCHWPWARG